MDGIRELLPRFLFFVFFKVWPVGGENSSGKESSRMFTASNIPSIYEKYLSLFDPWDG